MVISRNEKRRKSCRTVNQANYKGTVSQMVRDAPINALLKFIVDIGLGVSKGLLDRSIQTLVFC